MSKGQSLQDPFLNTLRKERVPVSIFLVNGIKLQGQIESFDQFDGAVRFAVERDRDALVELDAVLAWVGRKRRASLLG